MEWKDEVSFECDNVIAETDKAILCDIEGEEVWIPKVCISDNSEVYTKDTTGHLIISYSFARKAKLV